MSPACISAVLIRGFEALDAEAVSSIIGETMRRSNSVDYSLATLQPLIDYFSPEKVRQLALERQCLVAEIDGRVVGTIALDGTELCTFFVHPENQNCGIGARLLAALESLASNAGVEKIQVHSSLTGVSFYAAHGYEEIGAEIDGMAGKQIGLIKVLDATDLFDTHGG